MTVIPKNPVRFDNSLSETRNSRTSRKNDFGKLIEEKSRISQDQKDSVINPNNPDSAKLSKESQEIMTARKALDETPEVREELVSRIRDEIKNGTYEIDLDKVAESLINSGIFDDL